MTISKLIEKLEEIKATKGDIKVAIFDEYKANEGWGYEEKDLWYDPQIGLEWVVDEEVVCLNHEEVD